MLLRDILQAKGNTVHTITPDATLADVVAKLVEKNCGSLVVCDDDRMVGIITERDILRTLAAVREPLDRISVQDRMTRDVVTASPEDNIEEVMGVMTDRRIRHLPILHERRLVGMISIGDIVKSHHAELSVENHYLKSYIRS